jgi:hypothetical protein
MSGGREHERMWKQAGGWHGRTWWMLATTRRETISELREYTARPLPNKETRNLIFDSSTHIFRLSNLLKVQAPEPRDGHRPKLLGRQTRDHKSNPQGGLITTEGELGAQGVKGGSFRTWDDGESKRHGTIIQYCREINTKKR